MNNSSTDISDIANILRSTGKSRSTNDFPLLEYYFEKNSVFPSSIVFTDTMLNYNVLYAELKKIAEEILYTKKSYDHETEEFNDEIVYFSIKPGYMVEMTIRYESLNIFDEEGQEILIRTNPKKQTDDSVKTASIEIFCPPENHILKDKKFEKKFINDFVTKNIVKKTTTAPAIGMIVSEDGEYYIKEFIIKEDYSLKDSDLHYGKGFEEFHENLLERFKNDTKGLILFHGDPGTGKTFYIRSLLSYLVEMDKYVIYIPPIMVDSILDPVMINFLSTTAIEEAEDGKSCILLIEDAEPLLLSRKNDDNRTTGISNLLNITDGILNDMLSFQVIATFNTSVDNLDPALLRPERLVARKEFKKLDKQDAQVLLDKLGITEKAEEQMSLADIYSMVKKRQILYHSYTSSAPKKIGF